MKTIKERLEFRTAVLAGLDKWREQEKDPTLGMALESHILKSELADLEAATRLIEIRGIREGAT